MNNAQQRCGFVAIIGEPNAGKSTLLNRIVGGKLSIVSPKVQTTRFNIRGVCVQGTAQLIFVDTPGIFEAGKNFEKAMVQAAWAGIGDADAVLMLLDAQQGLRDSTLQLIEKLHSYSSPHRGEARRGAQYGTAEQECPHPNPSMVKKRHPDVVFSTVEPMGEGISKKSVFLAINKVDAIAKEKLFDLAKACDAFGLFERIFMISALKGSGVEDVKTQLASVMPPGPWLYPEDQMSDIPLRLLAAEITREKLFFRLDQELPYAVFVETERWEEDATSIRVAQAITVQREGQKKIVIGNKGAMIKAIGIAARKELEAMLDKRVHLELFVKVRPGWKDDSESYRLLGLEYKK